MFEAEAEERARKLEESQTLGVYDNDEDYGRDRGWNEGQVVGYEDGFKDGAEFGYNKAKVEVEESYKESLCNSELNLASVTEQLEELERANEWHYPSKGEYPKECEDVLCYCRGLGIKFCCVGHPIVGGDDKVRWWANNKIEELRVVAWKEITLPNESD